MKAQTLSYIFLNFSILSYIFLNIHLYRAFGSNCRILFFTVYAAERRRAICANISANMQPVEKIIYPTNQ
jgi:hypothetical protein